MAGPSQTVEAPQGQHAGEDEEHLAARSARTVLQEQGIKERDVFTVNSERFKERFPNFDAASKFHAPTNTKKGFFRRLKEFRSGTKAAEAPVGLPEPDKAHTIQFSDKNVLGEGACAVVVRAQLDGEPVAAKILKKPTKYKSDVYSFEEAKASLIKEIELLAGLAHANVVGLLGVFYEGEDIVMVQELMRCSLKEYINGQARQSGIYYWNTPPQMLLNWAYNLFDVLQFLHGQNPPIVHRDIKPDNLLVDNNMNIRLGDFGLSRRADGSRSIQGRYCMTGCCGSLRYMAPEVQDDDEEGTALYNEKVDVYSASMVLYFMATGHPPFHRQNAECAASTSIKGGRPTLAEVQNKYDRFFLELIRSTWIQSTRRRPSAAQVLADIASFRKSASRSLAYRTTRLLSPGRRAPPAMDEPVSPTLSAKSASVEGPRASRTRSMSPTRWIGSVFRRGSQSPVRGLVGSSSMSIGTERLDTESGETLSRGPSQPTSPSIGSRRISTTMSGIFSFKRISDGRKGSISPMRFRVESSAGSEAGKSEGSSFFRNISPSRLWRTTDNNRAEDGGRAASSSPTLSGMPPSSPITSMHVKPKLCSHIDDAQYGHFGEDYVLMRSTGSSSEGERCRTSSMEDIGEIDAKMAGVGINEPDIIAPLAHKAYKKSQSEGFLDNDHFHSLQLGHGKPSSPVNIPSGAARSPARVSLRASVNPGMRSPLPGGKASRTSSSDSDASPGAQARGALLGVTTPKAQSSEVLPDSPLEDEEEEERSGSFVFKELPRGSEEHQQGSGSGTLA